MTEVVGELFDEVGRANLLLVTTNASIKRSGQIVMGRGAAKQAAERWPELPSRIVQAAQEADHISSTGFRWYGLVLTDIYEKGTRVGAFQVKEEWWQRANLSIIQLSATMLRGIAVSQSLEFKRVAMNFPGIGNGGRTREEVLPLLADLPRHVFVYRRPE